MLEICERFATSHNLKFSTDPDPVKCKTKCIAFVKKPKQLPEMRLCGNNLPWVNAFKHLGNNISNQHCFTDQDISVKRAIFVNNCIELNQQFSFADPDTKWKIGQIYNSHYTGSPIWDLFGPEAHHLESSYNRNVKIVYDLPLATHRHLIETVSRTTHLRKTLVSRFLGFIDQIKMSNKQIPKMLLKTIQRDVRSTKGRNLRLIMIQCGKANVDQLRKADSLTIPYHPTSEADMWKENMLREIVDVRSKQLVVDGFDMEELDEMLEFICVG